MDYNSTTNAYAVIPAGETETTIFVSTLNDIVDEAHKNFTVTLDNVSNASLNDGTATATILDDDLTTVKSIRQEYLDPNIDIQYPLVKIPVIVDGSYSVASRMDQILSGLEGLMNNIKGARVQVRVFSTTRDGHSGGHIVRSEEDRQYRHFRLRQAAAGTGAAGYHFHPSDSLLEIQSKIEAIKAEIQAIADEKLNQESGICAIGHLLDPESYTTSFIQDDDIAHYFLITDEDSDHFNNMALGCQKEREYRKVLHYQASSSYVYNEIHRTYFEFWSRGYNDGVENTEDNRWASVKHFSLADLQDIGLCQNPPSFDINGKMIQDELKSCPQALLDHSKFPRAGKVPGSIRDCKYRCNHGLTRYKLNYGAYFLEQPTDKSDLEICREGLQNRIDSTPSYIQGTVNESDVTKCVKNEKYIPSEAEVFHTEGTTPYRRLDYGRYFSDRYGFEYKGENNARNFAKAYSLKHEPRKASFTAVINTESEAGDCNTSIYANQGKKYLEFLSNISPEHNAYAVDICSDDYSAHFTEVANLVEQVVESTFTISVNKDEVVSSLVFQPRNGEARTLVEGIDYRDLGGNRFEIIPKNVDLREGEVRVNIEKTEIYDLTTYPLT